KSGQACGLAQPTTALLSEPPALPASLSRAASSATASCSLPPSPTPCAASLLGRTSALASPSSIPGASISAKYGGTSMPGGLATMPFVLHPRLTADTAVIADWTLSRVLLMNDKRFPWIVLVPRRVDLTELYDLDEAARAVLMAETVRVSSHLKSWAKRKG